MHIKWNKNYEINEKNAGVPSFECKKTGEIPEILEGLLINGQKSG